MIGNYVGYVAGDDRLHDFLGAIMRDKMGVRQSRPAFRAFHLKGSNEVYAYEEKSSRARIICKFYGPKYGWDRDKAAWTAYQEYESLERLRGYDLVGSPHHVIRPLGFNRDIDAVLALEYYAGEQFSHAIGRAIDHHDDAHLYWRLKALAYFLATQHNRTANGQRGRLRRRLPLLRPARRPAQQQTSDRAMGCRRADVARRTVARTADACGRTRRSGCTAMRRRPTSCSATEWTSPRSTSSA